MSSENSEETGPRVETLREQWKVVVANGVLETKKSGFSRLQEHPKRVGTTDVGLESDFSTFTLWVGDY